EVVPDDGGREEDAAQTGPNGSRSGGGGKNGGNGGGNGGSIGRPEVVASEQTQSMGLAPPRPSSVAAERTTRTGSERQTNGDSSSSGSLVSSGTPTVSVASEEALSTGLASPLPPSSAAAEGTTRRGSNKQANGNNNSSSSTLGPSDSPNAGNDATRSRSEIRRIFSHEAAASNGD
ncbi:unnamed protein product, partial [Ectocarpus sp. 8 AP-2014]